MYADTGLGALSGLIGKALLLYDSFTDTNGTALTAHSHEVGPAWSDNGSNIAATIQNNQCQGTGNPSSNLIDAGQSGTTTGSVDCYFNTTEVNDAGNTYAVRLITRYQDASNYTYIVLFTTSGNFQLHEVVSGTDTRQSFVLLGSLTANTKYTLQAQWQANTLTATVNGGNALSYTSSAHASATKWGFYIQSDNTQPINLDNFQVTIP